MRRFLLVFLVANATQLRSEKTLQPESRGGLDKAVESARKNTSETAKGTDSPVDDLDVRAPWFELKAALTSGLLPKIMNR